MELQVRPRPGRRAGESTFRGGVWQEQKTGSESGKEPANQCGRVEGHPRMISNAQIQRWSPLLLVSREPRRQESGHSAKARE